MWPEMMDWARLSGACAWHGHTGQYTNDVLEQMLVTAAASLESAVNGTWITQLPSSVDDGRRVLHVLTRSFNIGGHTRLAEKWMRNASHNERHAYVLIEQDNPEIPSWLLEAARNAGGDQILLPATFNRWQKAEILRNIARSWADTVVLHTHPDDPVATVAFGVPNLPPVVLQNHSGHTFWLGTSISDHVLDMREAESSLSLRKRHVRQSSVLPISLRKVEAFYSKVEAKKALGLPEDAVVMLSIGASYKYTPWGEHHFPNTLSEILASHSNAIMVVIGPSPKEAVWEKAIRKANGKLLVCGALKEIDVYYKAADIYLEGFPIGSLTAALESALYGVPIILSPNPVSPILSTDLYPGMDSPATSLGEYKELVSKYIVDLPFRVARGQQQKNSIEAAHTDSGWSTKREQVLGQLPKHDISISHRLPEVVYDPYESIWAEMQFHHHSGNYLRYKMYQELKK